MMSLDLITHRRALRSPGRGPAGCAAPAACVPSGASLSRVPPQAVGAIPVLGCRLETVLVVGHDEGVRGVASASPSSEKEPGRASIIAPAVGAESLKNQGLQPIESSAVYPRCMRYWSGETGGYFGALRAVQAADRRRAIPEWMFELAACFGMARAESRPRSTSAAPSRNRRRGARAEREISWGRTPAPPRP